MRVHSFGGHTHQVGNFVGVARTKLRTPAFVDSQGNEREGYMLVLYSALSAFGLIGTEHNGIAVIDMQAKAVVLRDFAAVESGMNGPTVTQYALFNRLVMMDDEDFMRWLHDPMHLFHKRRDHH